MEAGIDAGGEHFTPYSKYVDETKVPSEWKARPASPATVTNIATLPLGQTKKNMKSFLRESVFPPNHDIRTVLYKGLAKRIPCNKSLFSAQMYHDFIAESYPLVSVYEDAPLPSFISDVDDLPSYCLNNLGKLEQRKILACINHHFPQISYCPILPPTVALFLHYDDSPSQVFVHSCHIIFSNTRHAHYMDQNKHEVEASALLFQDLIQRFTPSSHKTLVNLASNPAEIYSQWMKVLFYGLPFSYLVILFDMYLLEGYKALMRAAIAVLKFYRKVGLSNPSDILSAVMDFVRCIDTKVSTTLLFRKAYSIKLPSSKEIRKLHHKKRSNVQQQSTGSEDTHQPRNPWRYISVVRNIPSDIVNETHLSTLYCWIPERYTLSKLSLLFSTNKDGYSLEALFRTTNERSPTILFIRTTEDVILGAFLAFDWSDRESNKKSYFGTGETFLFTMAPECKPYFWVQSEKRGIGQSKNEDHLNAQADANMRELSTSTTRSVKKNSITLPPIHQDVVSPLQSPSMEGREESVVLPPLVGSPIVLESISSRTSNTIGIEARVDTISSSRGKGSDELFIYVNDKCLIVGGGNGYGLQIDSSFLHCSSDTCDTFGNPPLVQGKTFQCSLVEIFGFDS